MGWQGDRLYIRLDARTIITPPWLAVAQVQRLAPPNLQTQRVQCVLTSPNHLLECESLSRVQTFRRVPTVFRKCHVSPNSELRLLPPTNLGFTFQSLFATARKLVFDKVEAWSDAFRRSR